MVGGLEVVERRADGREVELRLRGAAGERTLHLLGVSHASPDDAGEVATLIARVRPDTVCVELDDSACRDVLEGSYWSNLDSREILARDASPAILALLLGRVHSNILAARHGAPFGAALRAAVMSARELGARLVRVERDRESNFTRFLRVAGWRMRLVYLVGFFSEPDDVAGLEASEYTALEPELTQALPSVVKSCLIDDRAEWIARSIMAAGGTRVVGVVSVALLRRVLETIARCGGESAAPEPVELERQRRPLRWLALAGAVVLVATGLARGVPPASLAQAFVLSGGAVAGLTALASSRSVVTAGAALLLVPVTALIPWLRPGYWIGRVQHWACTPQPEDADDASRSAPAHLSELLANPFVRVLFSDVAGGVGVRAGVAVGLLGLAWVVLG